MAYPYMNYPNMFSQPMSWNQYQQPSAQQTSFQQTNNPFTMVSGVADGKVCVYRHYIAK